MYQAIHARKKEFIVDLGNSEIITITTWKEILRVDIQGSTSKNFGTSHGLMGSFTDSIALRAVCCNRNRSNASTVKEELKSVVVEFWSVVMNTLDQAWVTIEPRALKGCYCFFTCFVWH